MIRVGASLFLGLIVWLCHGGQLASQTIASASPGHEGRADYVGDAACTSCHGQQSTSYIRTPHSLTSRLVNKDSVLGSFTEGHNILTIVDSANAVGQPGLYFKMEEKEDGYYQTAVTGFDSQLLTHTERMDLVTGSGVRGATYLHWEGDQLLELPVSYWTDGHRWINSPGYTNGTVDFSRPVNPGCLECHASYIQPLSTDPMTNHYDRTSLVTGITCERCHGPGAEHVARKRAGTAGIAGQAILNPSRFSRDRQVDLCALCHNGIRRETTAPVFSYVPGQPLSNYFKPLPVSTAEHPDVHGNQVGLLERSRCYLSSPQMSCSTCHDVHAVERPAAAYSEHCVSCHKWQSCGVSKRLGHAITKNCIDCHMPVEQTNVIVSETGDRIVQASMRNHWIKVYPPPRSKPVRKN